jgi:TonB-linked SusC/RagA family outer membrane protein
MQNSGMAGASNVSLLIRGLGTVNNADPLIVVDGMPDVDINRINMNDIENISILKDATSSAIYGSRAANGVILITTKTGKGERAKINILRTQSIDYPVNALQFIADYPRALTLHQRAALVSTYRDQLLFKDGTIDQWMALGMIDPLRYPNTDWWDIIMRNGRTNNTNVSASGSQDRSNFYISAGIMDQKGLQIENDFVRYNARINYDYKVRDHMNVGIRVGGNWSKWVRQYELGFVGEPGQTSALDMQYAISGITPYDPSRDLYGGVMAYNEDPQAFNPYATYNLSPNNYNRQEVNPSIYWDWTPVKGLTARLDYTLDYYNQFYWNASIPAVAYNFQTDSYGSRTYVGSNAGVSNTTTTGYKTQMSGRLNYNVVINSSHEIGAMVVYSQEYWYGRSQGSSRSDRLHPSLKEINAALTEVVSATGSSSEEGLVSYIGRLNYTAFNKYLLEANFRYDGSSKFLEPNQFGFFPSVSLGWIFTNENFLKPFTDRFMTSGKLRFSYGGLGNNSGVGRYQQKETLASSAYIINKAIVRGFINQQMINPNLTWESTYVMNIGADLAFMNNRLVTELDYYDRFTIDMLRPSEMSIHLTGAYTAPRQNIGELRNRGVEGNFTWRENRGDFNYRINLNASYNRNKLEKWNEYLGRGTTFIGMPLDFVYMYEDIGIAQTWQDVYDATPQGASPGDILRLDLNGDGRITGEDMKANPQYNTDRPTTHFGLNTTVTWKGIDLTVFFQGTAGRRNTWLNIYNNVNFSAQRYASNWDHWNEPWSVENRDGSWPRLNGNNNRNTQSFWMDDLSYLRLKNMQLGYRIPERILSKVRISSIRIFITGENLMTFTKYRGIDPEKYLHESDAYPLVKSFSFGINVEL